MQQAKFNVMRVKTFRSVIFFSDKIFQLSREAALKHHLYKIHT